MVPVAKDSHEGCPIWKGSRNPPQRFGVLSTSRWFDVTDSFLAKQHREHTFPKAILKKREKTTPLKHHAKVRVPFDKTFRKFFIFS